MNTITTDELKALMNNREDFTLVNTLNADSFEKTKLPGAVNVPLASDDFAGRVEKTAGGKASPIVVYCASSDCDSSEKAAQTLEKAGFTAVTRYTEGAAGWQQEAAETPVKQDS